MSSVIVTSLDCLSSADLRETNDTADTMARASQSSVHIYQAQVEETLYASYLGTYIASGCLWSKEFVACYVFLHLWAFVDTATGMAPALITATYPLTDTRRNY